MKLQNIGWMMLGLALAGQNAFAQGSRGGNGGNAVVCYSAQDPRQIESIEMFDYWEMGQAHPLPGGLDLGPASLSVREKIERALHNVGDYDPPRYKRFHEGALQMLDHLEEYLADGIAMEPIDDGSHDEAVPSGLCRKVQFAVQMPQPAPGRRRFQINRDLWNAPQTTNDARAGLILHEVIYREAIEQGQTNSDRVRYFNYAIATRFPEWLEGESRYRDLIRRLGVSENELCGIRFEERVQQWIPFYRQKYLICPTHRPFQVGIVKVTPDGGEASVGFDDRYFVIDRANMETTLGNTTYFSNSAIYYFFDQPSVRVESWTSSSGESPRLWVNGSWVPCRSWVVYANGRIEECGLTTDWESSATVTGNDGKPWKLVFRVSTNAQGRITGADLFEEPIELQLRGLQYRAKFFHAHFDSEGVIEDGTFAEPIPAQYDGHPVILKEYDSKKQRDGIQYITAYLNEPGFRPTLEGKQILMPKGPNAKKLIQEYAAGVCERLGFDLHYPDEGGQYLQAKVIEVGPYQEFYDLEQKKTVGKYDEKVEVLSASYSPQCHQDIPFPWN